MKGKDKSGTYKENIFMLHGWTNESLMTFTSLRLRLVAVNVLQTLSGFNCPMLRLLRG